ncbi:MAG: hypothetical protein OCD01_07805 [Fibrobacterales bacterium]
MDLRDKIAPARRFSEALLRFRLPLLLFFVVLYAVHSIEIAPFVEKSGALISRYILVPSDISLFVSMLIEVYGAVLLVPAFALLGYFIARALMVSWSTTLVQLLFIPVFLLIALLYEGSKEECIPYLYGVGGIAIVLFFTLKYKWTLSLLPILLTLFAATALYLEIVIPLAALGKTALTLGWVLFLALIMGDLFIVVSSIGQEVEKGKPKLGSIALFYTHFIPSISKISTGALIFIGLGFIPSLMVPIVVPITGIALLAGYLVVVLLLVPTLFSLVPYQRLFKK